MKKNFFLLAAACLAGATTLFAQDTLQTINVNGNVSIDSTLIVQDSVLMKSAVSVEGNTSMRENASVSRDFTVDGDAYFNRNLTTQGIIFYPNVPTVSSEIADLDLLFFDRESGQIEKSGVAEMAQFMYSKQCDIENGIIVNPVWNNGPNKIFTPCPQINVGIGTTEPTHSLHVIGDALFQSTLQTSGNVGIGQAPTSFSRMTIKSNNSGAGLEVNGTGNTQQFNKLLFLQYDNPSTELIKVVNTETNNVPFFLEANGRMTIHNGERKILQLNPDGVLQTRTVKVDVYNWPDYVFTPSYDLRPLSEVQAFISANGHLPEVPSATQTESEGIDVAEMNKVLLKKVEELTLYILDQEARIKALEAKK
jgi:hypothetical protein